MTVRSLLLHTHALAYGAIAIVLFVTIAVVPAVGSLEVPPLNPFGADSSEGEVLTVEVTDRLQSSFGTIPQRTRHRASERRRAGCHRATVCGGQPGRHPRHARRPCVGHGQRDPRWDHLLHRGPLADARVVGAVVAFAALVALVGRWRGVWSLVGLAASFLVIVRFIIPAILTGWDPVTTTVIGAIVIAFSTLVLAHGANWKTVAAISGTAISLALVFVFARFGVAFTELTGLADEHAIALNILSDNTIDARGLLLASIIIGALGVLDDVTATQASTVFELRRANDRLG